MPCSFVLPSWARPWRFFIIASNLAPGATSTTTRASSSPAFHQSCATPTGTCSRSLCGAMDSSPSRRRPTRLPTTVNHSSTRVWTCSPATAPPGRTYRSATSRSYPDSAVPTRTTTRSPVTGFWYTSPALDILSPSPVASRSLLFPGGKVDSTEALDAEVLGEDREAHVDVVLEPGEGGLSARWEDGWVVEDAYRY